MDEFRQAFPTPECLNDTGCRRLAAAILLQAAEDYDHVNMHELNRFIDSEWFKTLTDMPPAHFRKVMTDWKKHGQSVIRFINKWRNHLEQLENIQERQVYCDQSYIHNLLTDKRFAGNMETYKWNSRWWKYD